MIREIAKKSSHYFVWMVIAKISSTFAFLLFGRILGASQFGQFLYWLTIIQILTVFADLGTTHWQQTQEDHSTAFYRAFRLRLCTLGASVLVVSIIGIFIANLSIAMIALLCIALFSDALLAISDGYYLAQGKGHFLSLKVLSKTIGTLGFFYLFSLHSAVFALLAYILGNLVTVLWSLPWWIFRLQKPKATISSTLAEARSYALLIATSFAYARADSFLVGKIAGTTALGNYGAAYRYLEGVSMLPTAIGQVLFPLSARSKKMEWGFFGPLLAMSSVIGMGVGLLIALFSGALTVMILGESYRLAQSVLTVFSLVSVLFFVNAPLATLIQSSRKVGEFLPYGIANTLLNIILNLYAIPHFGAIGAAYAMLATEITGMLINIVFIRRVIKQH